MTLFRVFVRGAVALTAMSLLYPAQPALAADFVELPRLVRAGSDHQSDLASDINFWTVKELAKSDNGGLNADGVDATPPPGGWDDRSRPWAGSGLVSRTAGRLFTRYRGSFDGKIVKSSCSANVVTSGNKRTIVAAAHCFKVSSQFRGGLYGDDIAFNTVFIPGYDGSSLVRDSTDTALPGPAVAPYGVWAVTRAWITNTWNQNDYWGLGGDVAMATVERLGDTTGIEDVTGAQDIAFGVDTNPHDAYQFGYPADNYRNWYRPADVTGTAKVPVELRRRFDGRTLMYARGTTYDDAQLGGYGHDMISAMSPGSSGGPWLVDFDPATGTGTQIAVTSRFTNETGDAPFIDLAGGPGWSEGPASVGAGFGPLSQSMYDHVQTATP
ncbi:hypothetical protein [Actinocorallia libanotica]|uniref:Peptidase n=1 Tax=Actinocorallia libanotica TaxID=46162 RepID=A0ABP4BT78_9ACTN